MSDADDAEALHTTRLTISAADADMEEASV